MSQSSSQSTLPSSASKSPYASFFDLQSVFQCGCASDVVESRDCPMEQAEHQYLGQVPMRQALHDENEDMESARDCLERISKELDLNENEPQTGDNQKQYAGQESSDSDNSIKAVFRMSSSNSTKYPFLKNTQSESTLETAAISEDEQSLFSEDEEVEYEVPQESTIVGPVSILRRKVKLGAISASSGSAVKFCPTTVFPDPNAVPVKRKKVKRIAKPQQPGAQLFVSAYCDQPPVELRRLERRAQQNQYRLPSHRSSYSYMLPSESLYDFR